MDRLPVVYHPDYSIPLPEGHRFPMAKFRGLHAYLLQSLGRSRLEVWMPERPPLDWIELVHEPNFVRDYCYGVLDTQAQRRIGLPWSDELVKRTITAVGGTILTARLALRFGVGLNTAGGTHHAFPSFGSGFCIFNDMAIAIRLLQLEQLINSALIIDLDVHQGDGTAFIFSHDPSVITCSIHCEKNFPGRKRPSDFDRGLAEGTDDIAYLKVLDALLEQILRDYRPDIVLYNAGIDPHQDDLLGKMNLSDRGISLRDHRVLSTCHEASLPVACVIGGGYGKDMQALIERHALLFKAADQIFLD
ncbi:MAG: histone deacetylase [Cyanobacteria bacterium P01_F01_bin.42]